MVASSIKDHCLLNYKHPFPQILEDLGTAISEAEGLLLSK